MSVKTILITGCSSGIGYDAAHTLAKRGHRVIASCRSAIDLERLSASGLTAVLLDVSLPESITAALEQVHTMTGGRLDVLINNAGYGQAGALEDVSRELLREQFETNVFGLMDLTRRVIPWMRQQGNGRIINISSVLGFISMPFRGAYNASKYAVEGLSDTLRLELKPSGIQVITIEPGPIESRFRDNAIDGALKKIDTEHSYFKTQYQHMLGQYRQQKTESVFTRGADAVVCKLIKAVEKKHPKPKYRVTFPTHLMAVMKRVLSTALLDRIIARVSKKEMGGS
ncbi:SDR family NAD(P)-dependent oxidoreductase [Legionella sp. CNM-4043-24]|uniref:SDR family NAD(P)-dependent oxidoreductase n=1 Tax=Legionella sp. CNM-4043-24 TaxID=3421646 RepID=UPI00403AEEFF